MSDRIVLAYSGGLDTCVCIGWLTEQTGQEVVAVAVDVGQGGEDLERHPAARAGLRRGRGGGRRRPGRVRRGLLPAGAAGQRPVHGPLPAGQRAVPAADRAAPGRGRAQRTAPRVVVPRLHRQGQRPGAVRGRHRQPGPAPEGDRAGPRLRLDPGEGDRVRRASAACRSRRARTRRTRSTRTSGAGRWRPASWRTSGTPRSRTCTPTPPIRPCRGRPTRW